MLFVRFHFRAWLYRLFSIQETLALLTEDALIEEEATRKTTYYKITQKGSQMLEYFSSMLPKDTIRQIDEYLRDNKVDILEATTVHTDYSVTPSETIWHLL